jgi:hypothetical protein
MRQELAEMKDLAKTYKWGVVPDFKALSLWVTMYAVYGDLYILDIKLDNYKEIPPYFEFIDPDTGERGTTHAYPRSANDSFFHTCLCICAPFSRKAYKGVFENGPHADWNLGDWMNSKANGTDWSNYSKLSGMLLLIQTRLSRPELYGGRMG